jgi:hypothetical protein
MRVRNFAGLVVGVFTTFALASAARAATKISCVGEQSTHSGHPAAGAGHEWPDELGTLLGAAYTVDNDGDNTHSSVLMNDTGATPAPYTNNGGSYANPANAGIAATGGGGFARSIMSPDIVVIGPWGMHDYLMATGNNLALTQQRFEQDYDYLVGIYDKLANKPKIYLMTPLPFPAGGNVSTGTQDYMKNAILPAVKDVATKRGLPLIDAYAAFMAAPATPALLASDGGVNLAGTQKLAAMVVAALGASSTGGGGAGGGGAGGTAGGGGGSNGTAGAGGASGTAGGTAGTTGTGTAGTTGTGTAGTTGTGTAGSTGTGTAGSTGTGTAGSTGTTGAGGSIDTTGGSGSTGTGTAGSTTTGAAGTGGGTPTGAAGAASGQRTSSGGCSVSGGGSAYAFVVMIMAAVVLAATRRRRS